MQDRKVLIACPTLGINPDPELWLASLLKVINEIRKEGFGHACLFPYRQLWWTANNQIWDTAFANRFDYILRMDDDVWNVPDGAFSRLLAEQKTVIGAAYCNRRFPYNVQALMKTEEGSIIDFDVENRLALAPVEGYGYTGQDVKQVDLIGFGFTLINTKPFKMLERPIYKGKPEICPDDSYFAQLCAEAGIPQHVHFGVRVQHQHVTLQNAGHLFNADVCSLVPKQENANADQA